MVAPLVSTSGSSIQTSVIIGVAAGGGGFLVLLLLCVTLLKCRRSQAKQVHVTLNGKAGATEMIFVGPSRSKSSAYATTAWADTPEQQQQVVQDV